MSNAVFPLGAAGTFLDGRTPYDAERIDESIGGVELRSTWWAAQRTRYKVKCNVARSGSATPRDYQQLASFFFRHRGRLDSFLLLDPEDSVVSDHGFAVGDGVSTTFQLQRSLLGGIYDKQGGSWPASSKPRTNLCPRSQAFDNAAWTKTGAVVDTAPAIAPDGTSTAQRLAEDSSNGFHEAFGAASISYTVGKTYTHSVFAKAGERTQVFVLINAGTGGVFDLSAGAVAQTVGTCAPSIVACGNGWYRCSVTFVYAAGSSPLIGIYNGGQSYVGDGVSGLYIWGAQVEVTQPGQTVPVPYIPTGAAAVSLTPGYWPNTTSSSAIGYTEGFEPVFEPAPGEQVFVDGDWQGRRQLYPYARTNLCLRSQTPTDASWTKTNLTDGGTATAPDGTSTAEKYTSTATATAALSRSVAGLTAGFRYTVSCWLRCAAGGTVNLRTTEGAAALTVTSSWQRFTLSFAAAGASTTLTLGGSSTWANGEILEVWGFQAEAGPTATQYIATTSATVTVTDYSMPGLGAVTFGTPPFSGAVLSWSGTYYIRVRWDDANGLSLQRVVRALWTTGISLVSVKPTETTIVPSFFTPYEDSSALGTLAGAINGTTGSDGNAGFTLSRAPATGTPLNGFRSGVKLTEGVDFTRVGAAVTMIAPNIPIAGDTLVFDYFA